MSVEVGDRKARIVLQGVPPGQTRIVSAGRALIVRGGCAPSARQAKRGGTHAEPFQRVVPLPPGACVSRWQVVAENGTLTIEFDLAPEGGGRL